MKISKLFHWLYCAVMFLPLIIFLPNALYYGFNEHATNDTETQVDILYKYQSNEVNAFNDLIIGNMYYLNNYLDSNEIDITIYDFNIYLYQGNYDFQASNLNINIVDEVAQPYPIIFSLINGNFEVQIGNSNFSVDYWYIENIDFTFTGDFADFCDEYGLLASDITYSNYNVIENVEVEESQTSITYKMYQGWQQVWDLPLFSWTHNTFFSAPFNYISSLFGFQAGNSISYLLSYWFSISIIWLVFDLMIYVPLLVHRWLDKASIS